MRLPDERKRDLAAVAILVAILTILFADLLFLGHSLASTRDLSANSYPQRRVLDHSLRAGELPHWTHLFAGGQPFAANPGHQSFYPLRLLTLLVPDFNLGFHLEVLIHFYLAAIGLFVLLRSMNVTVRSAAVAALVLAIGGLLPSLSSLPLLLYSVAWLPWILFFARRFFATGHVRHFAMAALLLGCLLLAGDQSMILQAGALVVAFTFYDRKPDARTLAGAVLICVAASLVAAVQIAPALDFARGRDPGYTYEQLTKWSLTPVRLLELVFKSTAPPHPDTFIPSFYPGLLIALALVYGFATRVRTWRFTAVVAAISVLIAMGSHGPVYPVLYRVGVRGIRFPEKFFLSGWLVLLIFAALALDELGRRYRSPMATVLVAAIVLLDLVPRLPGLMKREPPGFYGPPPVARRLAPSARIFNDAAWRYINDPRLQVAGVDAMRIIARNAMFEHRPAAWGIQSVLETDVNRVQLPWTAELAEAFWEVRGKAPEKAAWLLSLAGVTDVLVAAPEKLAQARAPLEVDPVEVWPQPGNHRYFLARELVTARSRSDVVAAMVGRRTPPERIAFVPFPPFSPAPGRVLAAREGPNSVELEVESSGDALLVVAITRHQYWRATIDGRDAPLLEANLAFQALRVPAGQHRVAMRYRNPIVVAAGVVSIVAVLALIASAARPRSRGWPPPSPR